MRIRPTLSLALLAALGTTTSCRDHDPPSAPEQRPTPRASVYAVAVSGPATLGAFDGTQFGNIASGVNDAGDIVGITGSSQTGTLWRAGMAVAPASTTPLAIDNVVIARGMDINAAGQIAGYRIDYAALWTPTGAGGYVWTDIHAQLEGQYGSLSYSVANGINAGGQVTGVYVLAGGVQRCFLWTPSSPNGVSGTVQDIGDLAGTQVGQPPPIGSCVANDINSLGYVTGASTVSLSSPGVAHAFVYNGSNMIDVTPADPEFSYGSAINDGSQVAGMRAAFGAQSVAALWTPTGPSTWSGIALGAPVFAGQNGVEMWSQAMDLNDAGFVVGFTSDINAVTRTFFWQNGTFTELPGGGAPSVSPTGMTNLVGNVVVATGGSIVNSSNARNALRWAVTLTPVTQQGCLERLAERIGQLEADGRLSAGAARSLRAKVDAATRQADEGRTTPAVNLLNALINEVNALVASGRLSAADGQALIDDARCAIAAL